MFFFQLRRRLGSSPLSRGIQAKKLLKAIRTGIIPALAGNTSTSRPRPALATDHPRSRGEYWFNGFPWEDKAGSSPLSRGIPLST